MQESNQAAKSTDGRSYHTIDFTGYRNFGIFTGYDTGVQLANRHGIQELYDKHDMLFLKFPQTGTASPTFFNGLIGQLVVKHGAVAVKSKIFVLGNELAKEYLQKSIAFCENAGKPLFVEKDLSQKYEALFKAIDSFGVRHRDYPNGPGRIVMDGFVYLGSESGAGYLQGDRAYMYELQQDATDPQAVRYLDKMVVGNLVEIFDTSLDGKELLLNEEGHGYPTTSCMMTVEKLERYSGKPIEQLIEEHRVFFFITRDTGTTQQQLVYRFGV